MEKISWFIIILSAVLLVVMPGTVQGIYHSPSPAVPDVYFNPAVRIPNPDPSSSGLFGFFTSGIDIDGEIVIVGTVGDSAFLFDCSTDPCVLLDTLKLTRQSNFGYSVAIDGSNVLVGAPGKEAAYLFDCEDAIDAGDGSVPCDTPIEILSPTTVGSFGYFVAISGNTMVISNVHLNSNFHSTESYSVFIYTCDEGTCVLEETLPDPHPGNSRFGVSVAIDQNLVAGGGDRKGEVYVYDCTTFPCSPPVVLREPLPFSRLGWTISIFEDTLVAGNRGDAAYVFDCSTTTCTLETTIPAPTGSIEFAYDVDILLQCNSMRLQP